MKALIIRSYKGTNYPLKILRLVDYGTRYLGRHAAAVMGKIKALLLKIPLL